MTPHKLVLHHTHCHGILIFIVVTLIASASLTQFASGQSQLIPLPVNRTTSENLLSNPGFEIAGDTPKQAADWKEKGIGKNRRVCNTAEKTVAVEGNCAFLFSGKEQKLSQEQSLAGSVAGDKLIYTAYFKSNLASDNCPSSGDQETPPLWFILNVRYTDGTLGWKGRFPLLCNGIGTNGVYVPVTIEYELSSPAQSFSIIIVNRYYASKFWVDAQALVLEATPAPTLTLTSTPNAPQQTATAGGEIVTLTPTRTTTVIPTDPCGCGGE